MLKSEDFQKPNQLEEKILDFWDKNEIYQKSLKKNAKSKYFSFYDGPPFLSGRPHYGHFLPTTIKDVVTRFFSMRGFKVERRVGWDCHGLPVEKYVEETLGIKSKREIEGKFGLKKFNEACRKVVLETKPIFEKALRRVGRWADYKNDYMTMDTSYIESVWWVFKKLWDLGLVYKDFRVSPYCPSCGTPLSNFEVNLGYKEVEDESVYIKFRINDPSSKFQDVSFLVWTTTPWTLPANVALAVGPKIDYVKVQVENGEEYILAESRVGILDGPCKIIQRYKGKNLVGLKYEPLFKIKNLGYKVQDSYSVLPADFVSTEDGTGIVHIAPAFGEDDFKLMKSESTSSEIPVTVDEEGKMKKGIIGEGIFVKSADKKIIEDLRSRGLLYKSEKVFHNYPFCWRCDSPLLYYPIESWYVKTTALKAKLIKNNKQINWMPAHIKEGRFGKWLEEVKDWAISRNRFWGAPLPIWQCKKCGNVDAIGSLKELKKFSINPIPQNIDLHRPSIDEVKIRCGKCKGEMKRLPYVFDCWFESGSMPYAQWHYPFERKDVVEKTFPADFIAEGLDQTRGWFYTLHVLASALTLKNIGLGKDKPAFKNVVVNGLILDEFGRKLSKKLRNYPEPDAIFEQYGADSLRLFLISSTAMGEDYRFSDKSVKEIYQKVISKLVNSLKFYELYADKKVKSQKLNIANVLDKWIFARLNETNQNVAKAMEDYQLTEASRFLIGLVDDLSNWYIRRSRKRFQKSENEKDLEQASIILKYVLIETAKLLAPFAPFISEAIYKSLTDNDSVHLEDWPKLDKKLINKDLLEGMKKVREIAAMALAERAKAGIKVRQPLAELRIKNAELRKNEELLQTLSDEINVKQVVFDSKVKDQIELDTKITPELEIEGLKRDIVRIIQDLRQEAGYKPKDLVRLWVEAPGRIGKIIENNLDDFKKEICAKEIAFGKTDKFDAEVSTQINSEKIWVGVKKA
ncbi:MAG: isoleucine--tRNA ligase [Candidatus Paceibacterota bacterium]|jgi:isoleucyl-tRNA synthetase